MGATLSAEHVQKVFADGFHKHLDECKRCANEPHNLCPTGAILIRCAFATIELPFTMGGKPR